MSNSQNTILLEELQEWLEARNATPKDIYVIEGDGVYIADENEEGIPLPERFIPVYELLYD